MKAIQILAVGFGALLSSAPTVLATTTTVLNPWAAQPNGGSTEWNLFNNGSGKAGIMEYLYSSWSRVNDNNDQLWTGAGGTASVRAIFAGQDEHLFVTKTDGTSAVSVQDYGTTDYLPSRQNTLVSFSSPASSYLFMDRSGGTDYSSKPTLNSDGKDHMVTFGNLVAWVNPKDHSKGTTSVANAYVIAFEDTALGYGGASDKDYNDLVVEISLPDGGSTLILSGMAVLTLGLLRRKLA